MVNRTVAVSAARKAEGDSDCVRLNATYVAALQSAGLIPVIVPPLSRPDDAAEAVARAGGLVLTGGGDMNPALYGDPLHPKANPPEDDRDATELAMIAGARDAGVPTLAICRGIQVLNVALGGSLMQDISSQLDTDIVHDVRDGRRSRTHEVRIEPGSRLARAVGATLITVNSLHHQAVARLAPGLKATGHSPDGIVEGVETEGDWWAMGVQWHPEEMHGAEEPWDRGLFRAFAEAVQQSR
jgi:putative glutamine amidotransferase